MNFKNKEMLLLFKEKIMMRYTTFAKINKKHAGYIYNVFLRDFDLSQEEKDLIFD
jgi:hypothetical protein